MIGWERGVLLRHYLDEGLTVTEISRELGIRLDRQDSVVFLGPPGVGKTHLAISLAIATAERGRRICYGALADLSTSIEEVQAAGRIQHRLKILTHPALLMVDQIGYVPSPAPAHPLLPPRQPALRGAVHNSHLQPELRGVGSHLRPRGDGHRTHSTGCSTTATSSTSGATATARGSTPDSSTPFGATPTRRRPSRHPEARRLRPGVTFSSAACVTSSAAVDMARPARGVAEASRSGGARPLLRPRAGTERAIVRKLTHPRNGAQPFTPRRVTLPNASRRLRRSQLDRTQSGP